MERKKLVALIFTGLATFGLVWVLSPRSVEQKNEPQNVHPISQQGDKLKPTQEAIAKLSDQELMEEVASIEAKMRQGDLIKRLNEDRASEDEKKAANEALLRLALLNVEKSKRARQ